MSAHRLPKRNSHGRWVIAIVFLAATIGFVSTYAIVRIRASADALPYAKAVPQFHSVANGKSVGNPPPILTGAVLRNSSTALFPRLTPGSLYSSSIKAQNELPGTSAWRITGNQIRGQIQGFAASTFAQVGSNVPLYVSTIANTFQVQAYRMGWYQGLLGHLIWTSPILKGAKQPNCLFLASSNTTECSNWKMSVNLTITANFVPGDYLLKLVGNGNQQQYIPLTIVDPTSNSAIAIMNSVTTWEAYNSYGGYSLYHGPSFNYGARATKVSFDRPYSYGFGFGAADFLGNELPLVALAEKLGLNVTYINSIYLHEHPTLVSNHNVVVSLGHDEYYSTVMRSALQSGIDSGHSLVFLGANAIFRRIRFDSSPLGNDRIIVNYRNPFLDPLFGKNNANVTANWPSYPDPNDESALIGLHYACNPVNAPMVITNPTSWIFSGAHVGLGTTIPHLIGSEFDEFSPYAPHPTNLEILAHSPVLCRNAPYFSDMSYYSTSTGGGVFATGTNYWVVSLVAGCPPFTGLCPDPVTEQITGNILRAFGAGNVGYVHPSVPNAMSVYDHPPFGPAHPVVNSKIQSTSTTSNQIPSTTTTESPVLTTTSIAPQSTSSTTVLPTTTTTTTGATSASATTSSIL